MADEIVKPLDIGDVVRRSGYQFKSATPETGEVVVTDPKTGQELRASVAEIAQSEGFTPESLKKSPIIYNSPDTAVEESPLSFMDRVRVKGFGNTKGAMEFLKKNYDDVALDPEKGIVVNNKGLWQRIDPNYLGSGDAWAKTRELMGDIADVADLGINAAAAGKGAAIGGAVAGPLGAIGGAAVGGLASGTVRTLTGRILGTFNATPEEQLGDIGMEALLTMGGQAAGMGIGYAGKQIVKGIKAFTENAAPVTKDIMKGLLARVSAQGRDEAVNTLFNSPDEVVAGVSRVLKEGGGDISSAINIAAGKKLDILRSVVTDANEALGNRWDSLFNDMLTMADEKAATFQIKNLVDDAVRGVNDLGIGVMKEKGAGRALAEGLIDAFGNPVVQSGPKRVLQFVGNSIDDITSAAQQALPDEALTPIKEMVQQLNILAKKGGTLSGKGGAAQLRGFEKSINKIADNVAGRDFAWAVFKVKDAIKNSVANQYSQAGLGEVHETLLKEYAKSADVVKYAMNTIQNNGGAGVETLMKQLLAGPGKNIIRNQNVDALVKLVGKSGEERMRQVDLLHAVETFLPIAPRMSLGQGIAAGTAAAGGHMVGAAAAPVMVAGGAATFPRAAMHMVRGGVKVAEAIGGAKSAAGAMLEPAYQFKGWLQSLPPDKMKAFISDPKLFTSVIRTVIEAPAAADRMKQKIVEGVNGSGQQQTAQ